MSTKTETKPKTEPKPKAKKCEYTKETRPMKSVKLAKELSLWLALGLEPENFDEEVVRSMLGTFYKMTKKESKDGEDALSDKQYNGLYNIHDKFKVKDVFKFDELKYICVDISKFETLEVHSTSNQLCSQFYFEVKESDGLVVYTTQEFTQKYKELIKHSKYITKLPPSNDDDFD